MEVEKLETKLDLLSKTPEEWEEIRRFIKEGYGHYELWGGRYLVIDETDFAGRQYMVQIDTLTNEIHFIDDLVDLEMVSNIYDGTIDKDKWKTRHSKLSSEISKSGFSLSDAGNGGNDDYLWYQISTKVDLFTRDNLTRATKLWSHYNKKSRELLQVISHN